MITQHLLISLLPWAVGTALGCSLGYCIAYVATRQFSASSTFRRWSILIPWRTIVVILPLLFPLIPIWIGLGPLVGATMVGVFVFAFALPLSAIIVIEDNHPSPRINQLAALARTLATASIIVGCLAGLAGGGGLGSSLTRAWQSQEFSQVIRIFWEIVSITLIVDVLLGVLQYLLTNGASSKRELSDAHLERISIWVQLMK
ncbi:MAG: hypothetical protein JXA78_05365, partial [Anaerolineales bacterium]|nr:hypothetical protein [Anaerolineales bacterium]